MSSPLPTRLLDPLFTTDQARKIFSDRARLQGMLDFEAALARALTRAGITPGGVAAAIEAQCKAELFAADALAREAALAGNLAIPLVKALTAAVAKSDEKAAGFVHWGATSQDAIDTGLVLQLRTAFDVIAPEIAQLADALARVVEQHRSTVLAGRTWLQQASPITFGLKAAGWLDAINRHRARLGATRQQVLALQFGGAVGTLAALGIRGPAVARSLAEELRLELPSLPWHAQRDRFAEAATTLGLLVGTLGKIARDVSLMSQTEVGEALEPTAPGKGGSSTLPHKRNPVGSAVVLAAAIRVPALVSTMLAAMPQEHERGLGGWQAEWETLPEIFLLAIGALAHTTQIVSGLEVHEEKMVHNLEATRGLILAEAVAIALAKQMGRMPAHHLIEKASRRALESSRSLRDVLIEDKQVREHLAPAEIDKLLDPKNYTGSAESMIERVLTDHKKQR
ncbi:MAG: 3-carboxy-cis,cis-muconate cycloisomerase [Candidatus Acidiferrales bacterium]